VRTSSVSFGCRFRDVLSLLSIGDTRCPLLFSSILFQSISQLIGRRTKNLYFEEYWPPFWGFFTDDDGKLFVLTPEEGLNPGEYWYDIFNSDGVFIGRLSLSNSKDLHSYPFTVKAKNKRLYCLRKKESGFKELIVYKMTWE